MTAVIDVAGAVSALAYGWLAIASHRDAAVPLSGFFACMALAWGALLLAYRHAHHAPSPFPLKRMLAWAILFRLIGFVGQPLLEDDYHRYLWDGRLFAVQGSPYADRPMDHFADATLPPAFQQILDRVNHPHVPTIYGPVCQYAFLLGYRLAAGELWPLKLILAAADGATLWLLLQILPPAQVMLYAWCPLLIKETLFTAHVDSLGIAFSLAAWFACRQGRDIWAAVWLAFGVGARAIAGVLVPLLFSRMRKRAWLACGLVLLGLYAPFWRAGRIGEAGALSAFLHEWEFNSFGYALLRTWLGTHGAHVTALLGFGACYAWLWRTQRLWPNRSTLPRADLLYAAFFFVAPVVNPWYVLWILPFSAGSPTAWNLTALAVVTLSYAHGLHLPGSGLPSYNHPVWVRPVELAAIALAALLSARRSRRTCRPARTGFEPAQ